MAFGFTLTVAAGKIPSSQGGFTWLAVTSNFPAAAIDGGVSSILNGGGNLRAYTDSTKTTRLPVEIVTFVTGGSPDAQVWGLSPSLGVASTIYIEADEVETTQPASGAAFGRDAVYIGYAYALHLDDVTLPPIDSTGGAAFSSIGSPTAGVAGKIGDGVSTVNSGFSVSNLSGFSISTGYAHSFWANISAISNYSTILKSPGFNLTIGRRSGSSDLTIRHSGAAIIIPNGFSVFLIGSLHKYDISWENSDNVVRVYRDGVELFTGSISNTPTVTGTVSLLYESASVNTDMSIYDESVFRNKGLSADYITSEYNNQNDPVSFFTSSAWVENGGGLTESVINITVKKPIFSATVENISPVSNESSITLQANKPVFSGNVQNETAPNVSSISFSAKKPVFSASISNNALSNESTVSFTTKKPIFSASIDNEAISNTSAISFSTNKPIFSAVVNNSAGTNISSISFDIKKPIFSAVIDNGIATNLSSIDFSVKKPVFSATINNFTPIESSISFTVNKPIFSANVQNGEIVVKFNAQTNYTQPYLSTNYTQG